jgi:hypothetical protein
VAAGYTRELPLLAVAGGFLVHGHVAFILFVVLSAPVVGAGWLAHHGNRWRQELNDARRSLLASIIVLAIFAAPMILEVTLHYPGPWKDYLDYSVKAGATAHSFTDSAGFLGHFWKISFAAPLLAAAGLAGVVAFATDRNRRRRAYFLCGYGFLALQTLLFLYYVSDGIDVLAPINYYTGYFYETVPMFLVVFALTHAGMVTHERLGNKYASWGRTTGRIACCVLVAWLLVAGARSAQVTDKYRGNAIYPPIIATLQNDPDRAGRPIVLALTQNDWPLAAGMVLESDRDGLSMCLQDPYWSGLFTAQSMCATTAGHWQVAALARSQWDGTGTVIWSDATTVIFEGTTPDMPPR